MLTKLIARNFKRFGAVEIELGNPVVLIGPNNSGKTTALQALALWDIGLRRWNEKRAGKATPEKRPGVTINRRDLIAVPVPDANLLWRDLHVRDVQKVDGKQETKNIKSTKCSQRLRASSGAKSSRRVIQRSSSMRLPTAMSWWPSSASRIASTAVGVSC